MILLHSFTQEGERERFYTIFGMNLHDFLDLLHDALGLVAVAFWHA